MVIMNMKELKSLVKKVENACNKRTPCTRPMQAQDNKNHSMEIGGGHKLFYLTEELLITYSYWGVESQFSLRDGPC